MAIFESPALFIDFARLPPPDVIEEIDFEAILARYQAQVVAKKPSLASAVKLEQSPTNVILQAEAFGEQMVRTRINTAARATMLPFAQKNDLDYIADRFGVQRMIVSEATNLDPAVYESDDRLRLRIRLAIDTFSSAGTAGSYIYHAMSSDVTIQDASAIKIGSGNSVGVRVSIMNSGNDPHATESQLSNVAKVLNSPNIRPLTDVLTILPAEVVETNIVANVTLYPGPDASLVVADINKALVKLKNRVSLIGRDLTRSAIFAAINQEGVQSVDLVSPAADVTIAPDQVVWIKTAGVTINQNRTE